MIDQGELDRRFDHHPPRSDEVGHMHSMVRVVFKDAAAEIVDLCPPGRELACALTALEEGMMWANAAIARS